MSPTQKPAVAVRARVRRVAVAAVVVAFATVALRIGWDSTARPRGVVAARAAESPTDHEINPFRVGHTLIIPHSGGDALFPENTLYAYQHSMAMGGEVIDVDVSQSSDDVPMAIHDATVDRTTDGTGRVQEMTAAKLERLDAGYHFERDGTFPFRGQGITVPTLESILTDFPTTPATLDLKDQRAAVAAPICDLLRRLGRTGDVYVGSDADEQVLAFRATCPELRTSGTDAERKAMRAAREAGDTSFVTHQLVSQPGLVGDDGKPRVTAQTLAFAHGKGIAVLPWVVDDPEVQADLITMGVDGIYTRRPDVMLEVRRRLTGS